MAEIQTKGVILCGGKGLRSRRMGGEHTPKSLLEINSINSVDLVNALLQRCPEISDIRIALEYQSNTLVEYIQRVYVQHGLKKPVLLMVNEGAPYGGTLGVLENYINIEERKGKLPDNQNIIVLSADHLYGMDYSKFIKFHEKNKADITVAVQNIPSDQAYRFGVLELKGEAISSFTEKPTHKFEKPECLISMGIYIFRVSALKKLISKNLPGKDIGKHAIPFAVQNKNFKICGYEYNDFWVDVGVELGVWKAAFIDRKELQQIQELVYDKFVHLSTNPWPAEICKPTSGLCRVGNGSIIEGSIKNSIIARNCYIGPDVSIDECVIFKNTILIGKTTIKKTLIGSGVYGKDFKFGHDPEKDIENYRHYYYDSDGMPYPYVGKFGFIPAGESFNVTVPYDELHKEVFGY